MLDAMLGVVGVDRFELITQILLNDRFHMLSDIKKLLFNMAGFGPNTLANQTLEFVFEMHKPRKVLAKTHGINNGKFSFACWDTGKYSKHKCSKYVDPLITMGGVHINFQ